MPSRKQWGTAGEAARMAPADEERLLDDMPRWHAFDLFFRGYEL